MYETSLLVTLTCDTKGCNKSTDFSIPCEDIPDNDYGIDEEQLIENGEQLGWTSNFNDILCPDCKKK